MTHCKTPQFRCVTTLFCLREHFRPGTSRAVDSSNPAVGRDWPGFPPARFIEAIGAHRYKTYRIYSKSIF
jgi:hypothetical protein